MKSVVVHTGGKMSVEESPMPELNAPDDVLVRVAYSGLCGSDIPRIFSNGAHFYPITLGHEFSGHVVSTSTECGDLQEGDAVVCDVLGVVRDGQLRPAGHQRLRR